MNVEKDYYAVLSVSPFASQKQIKHAYYRLARRYHPDSREVDTPTSLFHEIQEAYAVLSDPSSRRNYDRQRDEHRRARRGPLAWNILLSRKTLDTAHKEQVLYALLEIGPSVPPEDNRLPLDLALVIDCSTSMKGHRLKNVKEAARQIIDELHDEDTLAIVSFNDRAEVVLSDRVGGTRAHAKAGITALRAEGGTEILQGLRIGLREVTAHLRPGVLGHVVLLTDGRTYGDDEGCIAAAERAGGHDIGITALGIGDDWNDDLLDQMASRSGGTSAYIASPGQVRSLLQKTVRGLGSVYATGLSLSVRGAEGVSVENAFRISPALERVYSPDGAMRLGTLAVDTPMKVLLAVAVDRRPPGEHPLLELELTGDIPSLDRHEETLKHVVRCAFVDDAPNGGGDDVPPAVLSALGKITLYRMQERAWSALAEGHVEQATRQLEMMATRLLDIGEVQLARSAMLEAKHIAEKEGSTDQGRKEIKYGTRSLDIGSEAYD